MPFVIWTWFGLHVQCIGKVLQKSCSISRFTVKNLVIRDFDKIICVPLKFIIRVCIHSLFQTSSALQMKSLNNIQTNSIQNLSFDWINDEWLDPPDISMTKFPSLAKIVSCV